MRNFLNRIALGLRRFMTGRYGPDQLGFLLIGLSLLFDILHLFIRFMPFYLLSTGLLIYAVFRILSKNIPKRSEENRKFLGLLSDIRQLKQYHIYRCPSCSQKIRIPRKGGKKAEITCPKCGERFIKKI